MEPIVILTISQRGNDLLYLSPISSHLFMKLTIGTSVMGRNMLMMKSDFAFVRFVSLNSDINLKVE